MFEKNGTAFIQRHYQIPNHKEPIVEKIINHKALFELESASQRIRDYESHAIEKIKKHQIRQEECHKQIIESCLIDFTAKISQEIDGLNEVKKDFFNEMEKSMKEFYRQLVRRLDLTMSDEDKILCVVNEITKKYSSETQLDIILSKQTSNKLERLKIPKNWNITVHENSVNKNEILLKFGFGSIVYSFNNFMKEIESNLDALF